MSLHSSLGNKSETPSQNKKQNNNNNKKTKGKGTLRKHCTLVDKVVSNRDFFLKLLYISTVIKRVGPWVADHGSWVSHCEVEVYKQAREETGMSCVVLD